MPVTKPMARDKDKQRRRNRQEQQPPGHHEELARDERALEPEPQREEAAHDRPRDSTARSPPGSGATQLVLRHDRPQHQQRREVGELEEPERDHHRDDPRALNELAPAVAEVADDRLRGP